MLKDVVNPVNTSGNFLVNGNSTITQETFINDATKAWNKVYSIESAQLSYKDIQRSKLHT